MAATLSIEKCPHGNYAVFLSYDGIVSAVRLTPTKCCKQWQRLTTWVLSVDAIEEIVEELANAANEIARQADG